jgi:hypothetical protein
VESPCPFYDHTHVADTWDSIDDAILACRDRHRAEVGHLLVPEQSTQTTEMLIAAPDTLIMPCLYCGAVTVLQGGLCDKCSDEGMPRV